MIPSGIVYQSIVRRQLEFQDSSGAGHPLSGNTGHKVMGEGLLIQEAQSSMLCHLFGVAAMDSSGDAFEMTRQR